MSFLRRFVRVQSFVGIVLMFPAVCLHELTHAVAALPWGEVESVTIVPPRATLLYPAGAPSWAIRLANLAPTIVGTVVGLPLLWLAITVWGLPVPWLAYLAGCWAVYTLPISDHDRNPFEHADTVN